MKCLLAVCLLFISVAQMSWSKEAAPLSNDPILHDRMMNLAYELRCLVCQGESLAESRSDFAQDMRDKITELMRQGRTDQQVKDFLVARYGDFILYRPPLNSLTALVWFGPLILLVVGAGALIYSIKRRRPVEDGAMLNAEERARVVELLREGNGEPKA